MLTTLHDGLHDEVIHGDRVEILRRRTQRLDADGDEPPLAIDRTTSPEGAPHGPVLLVHGFAQNRYTWRISRRSMSGFLAARGFDVLNVELRGHGNSREYGAGNATAFPQYVRDLRRVIATLDRPPFLIGHSLGGGACIGAAVEEEQAGRPVRGLVHMAGVFTFARYNRTLRAVARVSRRIEPALARTPARVRTAWAGRLLGRMYKLTDVMGYGLPLAGWAPGSMERDLVEERLEKGFDWTSVEVWLQMARWARGERFPYADAFGELDRPVFVIAGDRDPLVPHGDARACFEASGSRDKRLLLLDAFEHEGHWGHIDVILGTRAPRHVWEPIATWMEAREGSG